MVILQIGIIYVGPLPLTKENYEYPIVDIDYFTK